MQVIKYKVLGYTDVWNPETEEVEQKECLAGIDRPYTEANEQIAKKEAYNCDYTIEDDGQTEPEAQPTPEQQIAELEEALEMLLNGVTE